MDQRGTKPIAVIGFSRAASPLEPAWPSTHRALLPVAGKALIVHLVEQLVSGGIGHVRIAGSIQQYAVKQRLGSGEEWGIKVRYSDLHDTDLRTQTLSEHGHCLYLCGDQLHVGDFSAIRAAGPGRVGNPLERSESAAYWVLEPGGPLRHGIAAATGTPHIRHPVITARSYHEANMDIAVYGGLLIPGRELRAGVIVDWDTHIAPDVCLGHHITIGKHCRIGKRVHLDERCVLANGVVLGSGTRLRNVTVLPNTYIGRDTRLRDAIVTPAGLFDLFGRFLPSPDPSVIGRARGNAEPRTGIPTEKLSALESAAAAV